MTSIDHARIALEDGILRRLSKPRTRSARPLTTADVEGYRAAQRIAFECAQAVAEEMRPGWTESRVQETMRSYLGDCGVRTSLHKPIAAFGPRTLAPDAEWGPARGEGRTLGSTDVAILDCAPVIDGYTGDVAYTVAVGDPPELTRAQDFLSRLRAELPERFANPERAHDVFGWVVERMREAGYESAVDGYVGHVLGHRVYRHGRFFSQLPFYLPEKPFGYMLSWHSPGFLLKVISRAVLPEELGPHHTGPKTGIWAIEPHIRAGGFGAKFEELLVVDPDHAYWLDDLSQRRIAVRT